VGPTLANAGTVNANDNSSDDGNVDADFISPREKSKLHNIPKISGSHLVIKKKIMTNG